MDNIGIIEIPEGLKEKYRCQVERESMMLGQIRPEQLAMSEAIFEKMRVQSIMHQEHTDSLYECINVLKHQNLKLE